MTPTTAPLRPSPSLTGFDPVELDMLIRKGFRPLRVSGSRLLVGSAAEVVFGSTAPFPPGAHLEVAVPLPGGVVIRHYSLASDPAGGEPSRIAVRLDADGRGGSAWLHEQLAGCRSLLVRGPRDTFGYATGASAQEGAAAPALLIAGGIGITPLVAIAAHAAASGRDFTLLYVGRALGSMAYAPDLLETHGPERVRLFETSRTGRPDLVAEVRAWAAARRPSTPTVAAEPRRVYACGPPSMLEALEEGLADMSGIELVCEDFSSDGGPAAGRGTAHTGNAQAAGTRPAGTASGAGSEEQAFVVETSSGEEATVEPGESIIDALDRVGVRTLSSCRRGSCGTCETSVLEGVPDHRDSILSPEERAAGDTMLICVSRACSARLVLDV